MSTAVSEVHCVAHAVALNRLQARRGDDAAAPLPTAAPTGFADTVPLWFRSEAFAEDVVDPASGLLGACTRANVRGLQRVDAQVMAAGAAVLRLTLQALQLQRRGGIKPPARACLCCDSTRPS